MTHTRTGLLALMAALALLPLGVRAQITPTQQSPSYGVPSLSPAQKARADARMNQFKSDYTALVANKTMTTQQKQAKYIAMRKAVDKDMLAILTPSQRTAVLKQRAAVTARAVTIRSMAQALDKSMSPAQRAQVLAINQSERTQLTKVVADKSLSDTAKQQKVMAIRQAGESKREALMSPAQKVQYDKIKQMATSH